MSILRNIAYWTAPPAIRDVARNVALWRLENMGLPSSERKRLRDNERFKGKHTGERCFILATGPSIKTQDLEPLADHTCLAVSDFYRHESFDVIKPAYYCISPFHPPFTMDDARRRLQQISERQWMPEVFFIGIAERLMAESVLAGSDKPELGFIYDSGRKPDNGEFDISRLIPNSVSVTIMTIRIALFMGFTEIVLVGCDHDTLWKWDGKSDVRSPHFYAGDPSVGADKMDIDDMLNSHLALRKQYSVIGNQARRAGARIINASPASYLDKFERIPLESLV